MSDTKSFPHRSQGFGETHGMQIQDMTELRGETQTKMGAFGEYTEVLACCTVKGNKEQVPALDGPRTRRANAAVVSTFAKFGEKTDAVSNLRKRDPQQKTWSPMPRAPQIPKRKRNAGMLPFVSALA